MATNKEAERNERILEVVLNLHDAWGGDDPRDYAQDAAQDLFDILEAASDR